MDLPTLFWLSFSNVSVRLPYHFGLFIAVGTSFHRPFPACLQWHLFPSFPRLCRFSPYVTIFYYGLSFGDTFDSARTKATRVLLYFSAFGDVLLTGEIRTPVRAAHLMGNMLYSSHSSRFSPLKMIEQFRDLRPSILLYYRIVQYICSIILMEEGEVAFPRQCTLSRNRLCGYTEDSISWQPVVQGFDVPLQRPNGVSTGDNSCNSDSYSTWQRSVLSRTHGPGILLLHVFYHNLSYVLARSVMNGHSNEELVIHSVIFLPRLPYVQGCCLLFLCRRLSSSSSDCWLVRHIEYLIGKALQLGSVGCRRTRREISTRKNVTRNREKKNEKLNPLSTIGTPVRSQTASAFISNEYTTIRPIAYKRMKCRLHVTTLKTKTFYRHYFFLLFCRLSWTSCSDCSTTRKPTAWSRKTGLISSRVGWREWRFLTILSRPVIQYVRMTSYCWRIGTFRLLLSH